MARQTGNEDCHAPYVGSSVSSYSAGWRKRMAIMATIKGVRFVAACVLVTVGFVGVVGTLAEDDPPPPDDRAAEISERLRERGIDISPEQIDRARRVVEDIRDGVEPDPNQVRSLFSDFRKQMESQRRKFLQERLGATDEEWQILEPKIEKVRELTRQAGDQTAPGGAGRLATMGTRGRSFRNLDPNAPQPDVQKKADELRTTLSKKDVKPEEVTAALKAYREARAKVRKKLAAARKDLKALLTVRQEAQLVEMGILE